MKDRSFLRLGAGSLALAIPLGAAALPVEFGPVKGSLDTTVSLGATMRAQDPDDELIGIANGGSSRTVNEDDGNLNYKSGDVVSAAIKATHDLDLKYKKGGLFARTSYFYDGQADSDRQNFGKRGKDRLVSEIDMLDLYAYVSFDVAHRSVAVRAGKQVVNWGESTFIGNSINTVNAVDVARLRTPGSEIKEALLPVPMLWTSISLFTNVSMEALWIWNFDEIQIDPRGSFFSTTDLISDDGRTAFAGFGRRNDQHAPPGCPIVPPGNTAPCMAAGLPSDGAAQVFIPRASDVRPDNEDNQYGAALRYYADWLNNTEFGLFYLKYHSRAPLISAIRGTTGNNLAPNGTARYFVEYPEDIELYGLSFNTGGPLGIALQGEYSYRPNLPLQLASIELLFAALGLPNVQTGTSSAALPVGTVIQGFERVKAHQAQVTGTKAFGPTFGAEQFVLLGEAGVTILELPDGVLFNGPGTSLASCRNPAPPVLIATAGGGCQREGYADQTSWGYRAVARMDFENAIGPAQLSPRLVFAHDVNGVGPAFNQGAKAITVGLAMNYLQRWQADIGYTSFFGGRTYSGTDTVAPGTVIPPTPPATAPTIIGGTADQSSDFATGANPSKDRDFIAVSVSYAF